MEASPHPIVEGIVARLLPPACREHVLGDLHERYVSTGQYVWDAARTVPFAVWGQMRRRTSPLFAAAELGAVYIAFLGAIGVVNARAFGTALAPLSAAIAAITALVTVALRDAWVGGTRRSHSHLVLDAMLGVALAGASQALLRTIGSRLALEPAALLAGCATSLAFLAGVRVSLHSFFQPTVTASAGGSKMSSAESHTPGGLQRDLRIWWWTIAVVGFSACVGLLAHPATARIRPFILGWLAAFMIIGLYQRRQTRWPERPPECATTNELRSYREALELRRDEQRRWPARRLPVMVGTVTIAVLVGLVRWFAAHGSSKPIDAFAGPLVVAAVAFAFFVFTRKLANRAAAAFQRELDDASRREPSQRD
jgi:hypothetical protein